MVKLTMFEMWLLHYRLGPHGWISRAHFELSRRNADAIASLLKKGALESDGGPGGSEMISITDVGRTAMSDQKGSSHDQ